MKEPDSTLASWFGYTGFRGLQKPVIERTLQGHHSLVVMPTGSGKSLCFQIPGLVLAGKFSAATGETAPARGAPLTVVISPLIALMKDQVDALVQRGIPATFVNSSLNRTARDRRMKAIRNGAFSFLYVTPERFRKPEFCRLLADRTIVLLAFDEAHCISQWGHDFRPDYSRAGEIRQQLGNPVTLALTATATATVRRDIVHQLGLGPETMAVFDSGIDRPNLQLVVEQVWSTESRLESILKIREANGGRGIVYFTLIRTLSEFSDLLQARGAGHLVYHGDQPRHMRRQVQDRFMTEPESWVLATNAFGMGIDCADIRSVTHAELPGSLESYYQEIGRAGRDGLPSRCTLLYDSADLATQMEFVRWSNPGADYYERVHDFLGKNLEQVNAFGLVWLR